MRLVLVFMTIFFGNQLHAVEFGKIEFDRVNYDFGVRHRGEEIIAVYEFVNSGEGELIIEGVHAECGCMSLNHIVGQVYFPGDRGKIEVKFESDRFKGKVIKKIIVATNSKGLTSHTLRLTGTLQSAIEANPPILNFGRLNRGQNKILTAEIKAVAKSDFAITNIEYDKNQMKVAQKAIGHNHFQLTVELDAGQLKYGPYKSTIQIFTSHAQQKVLSLMIRANILSRIQISEKYIEFGSVVSHGTNSRRVEVQGINKVENLRVESKLFINDQKIENPDQILAISPEGNIENGQIKLNFSMKRKAEEWPDAWIGPMRGVVKLLSSENEEASIPIYGYFY